MRVDWAIPCRYAEVNDNLATIVGAGIDHTMVPALPAPVQVVLAVRLVALPDELGEQEHGLSIVARDAEHNQLEELSGPLTVERPEGAPADWLVALHIPVVVQFKAAEEGTYTLEVSVDDHTYPVPMHVVVAVPPGEEPAAGE